MNAVAFAPRRSQAIVEGEYAFTQRNFDQIAGMLRDVSGIALSEAKAALVYSRLAKRLRKLGIPDFDAYCAFVQSPAGDAERTEMMAALTTNVTRFFREPHHFDHLREEIAPRIAHAARQGGRIRLWSAACSSGEEPYSMAITLLDAFPEAAQHNVRILATDIDPNVLTKARRGVYGEEAVAPIPASSRERWLSRERDGEQRLWRVRDEVRALISFNELNLIGAWPMRGQFDVIFCRNVVIYFEEPTQTALWKRFHGALTTYGRLYVGHSERVDTPGFVSDGLTIYRLQEDAS